MKKQRQMTIKTLSVELRKAKRALKLANSVMEYCAGDKWEMECTAKDRKVFNKLYKQLTGEDGTA